MMSIKLALVPLDERPVNTRYPQALAAIAGVEMQLPPIEIRGRQRQSSDRDAVAAWLSATAADCAAAVVSCDFLGYGNLINARTNSEPAVQIIDRLAALANLPVPVHAFSLITRVSNADDNIEEPYYWKDWGTKFYAYSGLAHRSAAGDELSDHERRRLQLLSRSLPAQDLSDWLLRRLRNHTVNLALVDLAAHGRLESLLLTSDDTSLWGLPSRERSWIESWAELAPVAGARLSMHPGADEVGSALVAKLIASLSGRRPKIWVDYAIGEDSARIAPYEDRPVSETVKGQIAASGAEQTESPEEADLVLGVLTPSPAGKDYQPLFLDNDRFARSSPYRKLFERLAAWQQDGKKVLLADIAYPNGVDPLAMELLLKDDCPLNIAGLSAFGGWNTAGNTLGVVVAQGVCSLSIDADAGRTFAQETFLAHRFLEDWGYQTVVRREARKHAEERWSRREPDPESEEEQHEVCAVIETGLQAALEQLQKKGIGARLSLRPGSVRLPWKRTFEVDFDLDPIG